jgi:hypothetical protein
MEVIVDSQPIKQKETNLDSNNIEKDTKENKSENQLEEIDNRWWFQKLFSYFTWTSSSTVGEEGKTSFIRRGGCA